jgi:hypothetical protein
MNDFSLFVGTIILMSISYLNGCVPLYYVIVFIIRLDKIGHSDKTKRSLAHWRAESPQREDHGHTKTQLVACSS